MNAHIETLQEILDGIPKDELHAYQRMALEAAIDTMRQPVAGDGNNG